MLLRMGLLSHLGPIITLGAFCSVFRLQVTDTLSVSHQETYFEEDMKRVAVPLRKTEAVKVCIPFQKCELLPAFMFILLLSTSFYLSQAIYNVLRLPLGVSKICVTQKFRRS